MEVIAVDAAPGKASTVLDGRGEFAQLDARDLRCYLDRIPSPGRKPDAPDLRKRWDHWLSTKGAM